MTKIINSAGSKSGQKAVRCFSYNPHRTVCSGGIDPVIGTATFSGNIN
jgi:hypothetical protein